MNHSIATALTNPGAPMKVRGVQKRFGAFTALDNVSLDVAAGELVCLLGPSGCGKTTLLRCIAGLEKQDGGELYLGDRDVSHLAPQARDYGILFQSYALFPNLTVEANIAYGLAGSGRDEVRRRVGQMLELVGLTGSEKKYPGQLSGGQQQRVAIARALVSSPSCILADEPTGALDTASGKEVMRILLELHAAGHTVILVTHDPKVAANAERIIEVSDGEILSDRSNERDTTHLLSEEPVAPKATASRRLVASLGLFKEAFAMAWVALISHRMRTLLTMLGIVIGITSVVSISAVGEGAKNYVLRTLRRLAAIPSMSIPAAVMATNVPPPLKP